MPRKDAWSNSSFIKRESLEANLVQVLLDWKVTHFSGPSVRTWND
jgi:hypothetical protein